MNLYQRIQAAKAQRAQELRRRLAANSQPVLLKRIQEAQARKGAKP